MNIAVCSVLRSCSFMGIMLLYGYHAPKYCRLELWICTAWFPTQLRTMCGGGGFG